MPVQQGIEQAQRPWHPQEDATIIPVQWAFCRESYGIITKFRLLLSNRYKTLHWTLLIILGTS